MKTRLPKTLLFAVMAATASTVLADPVTEQITSNTLTLDVKTTETKDSTYQTSCNANTGTPYGMKFSNALVATNSSFILPRGIKLQVGEGYQITKSGNMTFEKAVTATNCTFSSGESDSGYITFKDTVTLNEGNTFTCPTACTVFDKSVTINGNNNFYGTYRFNNSLNIESGTVNFERIANAAAPLMPQGMIFNGITLGNDAALNIVATESFGNITFTGEAEVTSLNINTSYTVAVNAALTVQEAITMGSKVSSLSGPGIISLEIDSLADLEKQLLTIENSSLQNRLKTDARFELLFTESALDEMQDGQVLDLSNITNVDGIVIGLAVEESAGISAEDVFGLSSFTSASETSGVGDGVGSIMVSTNAVPEPTTATLSLLALAGLCARRRRASL